MKEEVIGLLTEFATELMILECEGDIEGLDKQEEKLKRAYATKINKVYKNANSNKRLHAK